MSCNNEKHLAGRQALFAFLDKNSIAYEETRHPAVTSMQESARLGLGIEGVRCKNLFMQGKKKQRFHRYVDTDLVTKEAVLARPDRASEEPRALCGAHRPQGEAGTGAPGVPAAGLTNRW